MSQETFKTPQSSPPRAIPNTLFSSSSSPSGGTYSDRGISEYGNLSQQTGSSSPPLSVSSQVSPRCSQPRTESFLVCYKCNKQYKNRSTLKRHTLLHMYKESIAQVTEESVIATSAIVVENVLQQMLKEPAVGDDGDFRRKCLHDILDKINSREWLEFVHYVVEKMCPIFFEKSKLMPQKQYEVNLCLLHQLLTNETNRKEMIDLVSVVIDFERYSVESFVFRFCSLLFRVLQVEVIKMMQKHPSVTAVSCFNLSLDEKQALYYSCGSIFQSCLRKCRNCSKDSVWSRRRTCILQSFVFIDDDNYTLEFLRIKSWFDKRNRGGLIAICEDLFRIFCKLEEIVQQNLPSAVTTLESGVVLSEVLNIRNDWILQIWWSLTYKFLKEIEIDLFLEDIVCRFVKFSVKAEADRRMRDLEDRNEVRAVALRTDLKHN